MITEKLQQLNTDLLSSYTTIANRGGSVPSKKNSNNLAAAIATIPVGGGTRGTMGEAWQPHPDWWDIETIIKADTEPTTGGKVIYLLNGDVPTTPLSIAPGVFYKVKTSDGQLYESTTTHAWDVSKDKLSADKKIRTRWFIGYTSETAKDFGAYAQATQELRDTLLYCVMKEVTTCGQGNTSGQRFGASTAAQGCRLLESVKFLSVGSLPNSGTSIGLWQNCASLQKIEFPPYTGEVGALYLSFTNVSPTAFIRLPEFTKITSINNGMPTLIQNVRNLKIGRSFNFVTKLSAYPYLSVDTWTDIAAGLEDNISYSTIDLEIGAVNIERLANYKTTTGIDLIKTITDKNYNVL